MKQTATMIDQQVGRSLKSKSLNCGSGNSLLKRVGFNNTLFKLFFFVFVFLLSVGGTKAQSNSISSSSINNNLCSNNRLPNGNQIIFYAGGSGQFYQWYDGTTPIGGSTASTTFTVPSPGNYHFETSFSNPVLPGSLPSGSILVSSATALSITNNLPNIDELFPTNSPSSIYINTTNPPDYTFIDWYRNGVTIPTSLLTSSFLLKLPGNYMAVAGGCTPERSNVDIVKYETSNGSWNSGTFSSGATYSTTASITSTPGTGYLVGGDIVVQSGGVVTVEAILNFTGCYNITVQNGGTLNITNSSVLSATNQWKGILVENGGVLNIDNNSYICDAVAGVITHDSGKVNIQESTFGRNALHLAFDQYSGTTRELIIADTFGHVLDPDSSFFCGYSAYNNLGSARGTYAFVKGTTGYHPVKFLDNEIYLIDSSLNDTIGWLVAKDQKRMEITSNNLQGFFDYGMILTDCSNVICDLNDFYNAELLAADYGYPPSGYPRKGSATYFKDNNLDTIIDNEIKGWMRGMEFYVNNGSYSSIITGNRYRYGYYGLLIANLQYPITTSTTNTTGSGNYSTAINLKIECNLFKFNNYGLVGSGNLNAQGTTSLSAGNRFYDVSVGGLLSLVNSIIWNNNGSLFNYYCNSTNDNDDPQRINNGNVTIDNVGKNGSTSDFSIQRFGVGVNMCTSQLTLIGPSLSVESVENKRNVSIYPNPSDGLFNLKGLSVDGKIEILGLDGKILFYTHSVGILSVIDISNLPSGIYMVKATDIYGVYNFKLIKT